MCHSTLSNNRIRISNIHYRTLKIVYLPKVKLQVFIAIEYNKKNICFSRKHAQNEAERLVPDPFWSAAWFQYIWIALNLACNKNQLFKNFRLLIQLYAQF